MITDAEEKGLITPGKVFDYGFDLLLLLNDSVLSVNCQAL